MASASDEFRLVSPGFNHEGRLPRKYTDEGQGAMRKISPPLEWYNLPEGTKSLALLVQDIDAPDPSAPLVPWVVWVVTNIPPSLTGLPEGFSGKFDELDGDGDGDFSKIREGKNDDKVFGWRAPKLPSHGHRFEFRLFALDAEDLHLGNKPTKDKLLEAVDGHTLAEAVLIAKL
ncbi:unnamed protein product [Cuscuta epithymum]|uniref:Uncharacterized protein n=1 Tax=Cuscuta epithymum TaxID=186058 RepID=A0AAV0CZ02_9ASTE|nr:unnamed protein product [Cuscuta epithymum]